MLFLREYNKQIGFNVLKGEKQLLLPINAPYKLQ